MAEGEQSRRESWFPKLATTPHRQTSRIDPKYNCIAWALGDARRWWEPDEGGDCYWPCENRTYTVAAYAEAITTRGYEECDPSSTDVEPGYLKVALFADRDGPTHMARQKSNGFWTSKLGTEEDIEHTIEALTGDQSSEYGRIVKVFRKPIE